MKRDFSYFLNFSFLVYLLGYCVDQFDMSLFSIVRVSSLQALGLSQEQILTTGTRLLNVQMAGMLVGGLIGGLLGDKKGRRHLLIISIFLYAIGNIANAFVTDINQYALCRFISGLGLAAEMGASLTLIIETIPRRIAVFGIMALIGMGHAASMIATFVVAQFEWKTGFFIGGVLGLTLLLMRTFVKDSEMFEKIKQLPIKRGDLKKIFFNLSNFIKFIIGVLIGTPNYVVSLLIVFSPEILKAQGVSEPINLVYLFPFVYVGMVLGDFIDGVLSQRLRNRKWTLVGYQCIMVIIIFYYFSLEALSTYHIRIVFFGLGFVSGQWVVINTMAAEQFGTDIRATVATLTPNLIRASLIIMTFMFSALKISFGVVTSAIMVTAFWLPLSIIASVKIQDTFKKEIDYCEGEMFRNWA